MVGTKQRSLAHILLCILLFWLANIQDGRPLVILGWRHSVRVLARARAAARALERASVRECAYARVYGVRPYTRTRARSCVRGIQCTEQCTERCIYTREIIAIGGALVSSRYIDLPASSSLSLLPKSEDFLRAEGRNDVRPSGRSPVRPPGVLPVDACTRVLLRTRIASATRRFRGS